MPSLFSITRVMQFHLYEVRSSIFITCRKVGNGTRVCIVCTGLLKLAMVCHLLPICRFHFMVCASVRATRKQNKLGTCRHFVLNLQHWSILGRKLHLSSQESNHMWTRSVGFWFFFFNYRVSHSHMHHKDTYYPFTSGSSTSTHAPTSCNIST